MERYNPSTAVLNEGPFEICIGKATSLGANLDKHGCNFVVYCPGAERVELCLFDHSSEQEVYRISMPGKTGRYWHAYVKGVKAGQLYGYRLHGHHSPEEGLYFDPNKLLIDPYARMLNRALHWDYHLYQGDSQKMVPKAVVCQQTFDWQGIEKPYISSSDTVLYELHVKGFTQKNPHVPAPLRGTYLGICQPSVIEHLKALGVTTLQLMPVAAFMSEPHLLEMGLSNYWGYNPVNFFTPEPRYAVKNALIEFKQMVRELHRHQIEVVLDVVFNHSAEGGFGGPILSFRGFDNRNFYLFERDNEEGGSVIDYCSYVNNSGCGNSVALDNTYVLQLVMDSLRYWVEEMQVDGFRFDLAVSLAREGNEFDHYSAFFKVLFQDPVLNKVKLIAEPWDIGMGGYRLGQFPTNWHECNDRFRDSVRGFWRGDKGILSDFTTRLLGSRDVFHKGLRSIYTSVNYVTYHDGYTLHDLVTYEQRHNLANGEGNRDGHQHNLSCNWGVEGETVNAEVQALRARVKRNLLATLLMSVGTPHLLAGDELCRTQHGNNNAYCQDNAISWLDWYVGPEQQRLREFIGRLVSLRKQLEPVIALNLTDDAYYGTKPRHTARWLRADGRPMRKEDWHDADNSVIALEIFGNEDIHFRQRILLLFNASRYPISFHLPQLPADQKWEEQFNTALEHGVGKRRALRAKNYELPDRSMALLMRKHKRRWRKVQGE